MRCSLPGAITSLTLTPRSRTGRCVMTMSSGAIVPRAQHAKS
jgi:hypothetical protein